MATPVQKGEIIARKYRVERVIGEGGMGVIVAARHIHLDELVAIKLLRSDLLKDERAVHRFMREARLASKIKSEHVVRVSDVDMLDSGEPYIVMEYLRGRDLQSICAVQEPLDVEDAVGYVLQACDAIGEAHGRGIVHRDLKPANLFLARRPNGSLCVKVLDFGISKLSEQAAARIDATSTSTILGSPNYMSPEQMRSTRDVDGRTDIWSLGVTLYQLLTGTLPFQGETAAAVHGKVQYTEPRRPRELRPDLPLELEVIIARCLEKDPAKRFQTVFDLACALVPFGPEGAEAPEERYRAPEASRPEEVQETPGPGAATGASISFEPTSEEEELARRSKKRRRIAWFVAGVALLVPLAVLALIARKAMGPGDNIVSHVTTNGASVAQPATVSPSASEVTAALPPPVVSAVAAVESASGSAIEAKDAGARVDAGAQKGTAKSAPVSQSDKAQSPKGAGAPVSTASPPGTLFGNSGLDTEKCFARMPDGTKKEIPCK